MMRRFLLPLILLTIVALEVAAQPAAQANDELPVYYVVRREAPVYLRPDSGQVYVTLGFRESVHLLERRGAWSYVRTEDGARGYVATSALSNVWIRISKRQQMLYVYRGSELFKKYPADFGLSAYADKEQRGSLQSPDHWRTPEGVFFVTGKNPRSQFYKALVLNYPTAEDAARGLRSGIISRAEHDAIVRAEAEFRQPPMGTALGGMIEIHGDGTGAGSNWTQGCIAISNQHINEIWNWIEVGTPVLVEH